VNKATREKLALSLERVIDWVRTHDYRGYEPADGNSSFLFPLTAGKIPAMRVLQQVVLRAPFNIRPALGIKPHTSAIGRGYMASAYLAISRRTSSVDAGNDARSCLHWLIVNRAPGYDELCWGDPYEYATRSGRRPFGEPILIWTALIGQVFLDAFELFHEPRYLEAARSVGRWILGIPREETESGLCLSYVAYRQSSIHNSNAMGAAFLARLAAQTGDAETRDVARSAMLYTCARQRPDGAWFYAEEPRYHWIDNFHTGYNLSALKAYRAALNDTTFDDHLSRGMSYFVLNFFEADGRPKYFNNRLYPIDVQCAAQAIETLLTASDGDVEVVQLALRVANWTIDHLQAADGHFCYRDLGRTIVTTPMFHWGQGTMAKALAVALERLE
jgi:hypothetical protein